jgi:hypothetical protein
LSTESFQGMKAKCFFADLKTGAKPKSDQGRDQDRARGDKSTPPRPDRWRGGKCRDFFNRHNTYYPFSGRGWFLFPKIYFPVFLSIARLELLRLMKVTQKVQACFELIRPELPIAAGICVMVGQSIALGKFSSFPTVI